MGPSHSFFFCAFFRVVQPTCSKHELVGNKLNQNGKRDFFSLSLTVHLGTFTLGETRPEGLANKKKRAGQQEWRVAVAAGACGLDTHGPLCVRSRTVKRPNVQKLKRLNLNIMTGFKHVA